jgi:hypothetical protein
LGFELTADCEKKLLNGLLKTWGKVWHTWPDPKTDLPIGAPVLMWSATGKNQVRKELVNARDERSMPSRRGCGRRTANR